MGILGGLLMAVGGLGLLVTGLWMLVLQFKTSILWGLGCLIIPLVSLVWLVMHWEVGKRPFLFSLVAAVVFGIGAALSSAGGHN